MLAKLKEMFVASPPSGSGARRTRVDLGGEEVELLLGLEQEAALWRFRRNDYGYARQWSTTYPETFQR